MAAARWIRGEAFKTPVPIATAIITTKGNLAALVAGTFVDAGAFTWTTDLATTQAAFRLAFVGVCAQTKTSTTEARVYGNSTDNRIMVNDGDVWEYDTASASYAVGDLVGPAKQTGNLLEPQKVAAVATELLAIGKVVEATASSTRVKVRIFAKLQNFVA